MKTHLTSIIGHLMGTLKKTTTFLRQAIEGLMPLRLNYPVLSSNSSESSIGEINRERIFGPLPFIYSENSTSAFFSYRNTPIKKSIWSFKYYLKPKYLEEFSNIMSDELISHLSDNLSNVPFNAPALLTYCPSSSFDSGKKKWDHMKELSLIIETGMNQVQPFMQICTDAIAVAEKRESQHSGNKKERLAWSKERFALSALFKKHIAATPHCQVICIDDIITTGATMMSVKNIFADEGVANIKFFALCFTPLAKSPK